MTQTTTNPGCVDPAGQSYAPPPAPPARPSPVPRSLPTTSTGEVQVRSSASTTSNGVATEVGGASSVQSTGEVQLRNLARPELGATTCRGLPTNVHAGSSHPGGLAAEVVIK